MELFMFTHTGIKRARHSLISDIQYVSGHFDILHDLILISDNISMIKHWR